MLGAGDFLVGWYSRVYWSLIKRASLFPTGQDFHRRYLQRLGDTSWKLSIGISRKSTELSGKRIVSSLTGIYNYIANQGSVRARMPRYVAVETDAGTTLEPIGTRNAVVNMRMVRFREQAGLRSWAERDSDHNHEAFRKIQLSRGMINNSTRPCRDFTTWDIAEIKKDSEGKHLSRAGDFRLPNDVRERRRAAKDLRLTKMAKASGESYIPRKPTPTVHQQPAQAPIQTAASSTTAVNSDYPKVDAHYTTNQQSLGSAAGTKPSQIQGLPQTPQGIPQQSDQHVPEHRRQMHNQSNHLEADRLDQQSFPQNTSSSPQRQNPASEVELLKSASLARSDSRNGKPTLEVQQSMGQKRSRETAELSVEALNPLPRKRARPDAGPNQAGTGKAPGKCLMEPPPRPEPDTTTERSVRSEHGLPQTCQGRSTSQPKSFDKNCNALPHQITIQPPNPAYRCLEGQNVEAAPSRGNESQVVSGSQEHPQQSMPTNATANLQMTEDVDIRDVTPTDLVQSLSLSLALEHTRSSFSDHLFENAPATNAWSSYNKQWAVMAEEFLRDWNARYPDLPMPWLSVLDRWQGGLLDWPRPPSEYLAPLRQDRLDQTHQVAMRPPRQTAWTEQMMSGMSEELRSIDTTKGSASAPHAAMKTDDDLDWSEWIADPQEEEQ